jgi:hypothetical protein
MRNKTVNELSALLKTVREGDLEKIDICQEIERRIVANLPDRHKEALDLFGNDFLVSGVVSERLAISIQQASTTLSELYSVGLLKRSTNTNEHGLHYVYVRKEAARKAQGGEASDG